MAQLLLNVRRWWASEGGPTQARRICFAIGAGLFVFLVFARKPWDIGLGHSAQPKLADIVAAWSWWAAAANMVLMGIMGVTSKWWALTPRKIPGTLFPSSLGRRSFWFGVISAAIFLAATAWPRMGQSAWHDEANRIKNTTVGEFRKDREGGWRWRAVPWRNTFFHSQLPNHHLQTVLSRACHDFWQWVHPPGKFPLHEAALRMPSFLAGIAAVILLGQLLRMLGYGGAGIVASWLLAVHPWMLRYTSEARGYALAMALVPAVLICWIRAIETGRARWWLAFAAAEFALVYSYITTVWVLIVLNFFFPLAAFALRRQGLDVSRTLTAWLAANVFAGAAFLQMTAPAIPQLSAYFASEKGRGFGWTLDGFWLQNTLTHFLAAIPWTYTGDPLSSRLEMLPWARAHPGLFVAVIFLVVGLLALGFRGLSSRGPLGALTAAVFLLPAPLAFIQSKLAGTMMLEWYLIFALPGWCAAAAIGLREAVPDIRVTWLKNLLFAGCATALLLAYAMWTQPQRMFLIQHSVQPYREGVLLTRPSLDPNHPDQDRIITAAFHAGPLFYDPRLIRVKTREEMQALAAQAEREEKALYLNLAYPATAKLENPELWNFVYQSGAFEWVSELHGLFPDMDIHVLRYKGGREKQTPGANSGHEPQDSGENPGG